MDARRVDAANVKTVVVVFGDYKYSPLPLVEAIISCRSRRACGEPNISNKFPRVPFLIWGTSLFNSP